MKYQVWLKITREDWVSIEALSEQDANEKVQKAIDNGDDNELDWAYEFEPADYVLIPEHTGRLT
jgi:predicted nucleic acid-binding protein